MPVIHYKNAIQQIVSSYKHSIKYERESPFFYIVGAGISYPSVPLAKEMCLHFKEKLGEAIDLRHNFTQEEYMQLFERAYIEKSERRDYLKKLMNDAYISYSNFLIAHLLSKEGKFSDLVITVNFDDLLSKALNLFGENPLVIDYPDYIERMLAVSEESLKIVHVHGSYRFYDCKNLQSEIFPTDVLENVLNSKAQKPYYKSIYGYLLAVMAKKVPIVIGYSGWNDVIAASIKQRLKAMMGAHCYWFCYNEKDYRHLSADIKRSEDVFIVVNNESVSRAVSARDYTGPDFELKAEIVLSELVKELGTDDIELLRNPFEHYKKILEDLLPVDGVGSSLYNFNSSIELLAEASNALEQKRKTALEGAEGISEAIDSKADVESQKETAADETQKPDLIINEIYSLGRTGEKVAAVNKIFEYFIKNTAFSRLSASHKEEVSRSVHLLSSNISLEDSKKVLSILDDIIKSTENYTGDSDFWSTIFHERAVITYNLEKDYTKAIAAHKTLIELFKNNTSERTKDNVVRSMYAIGWICDDNGKYTEANVYYDEIINKFGNEISHLTKSIKVTIANAYLSAARNFSRARLNKPDEAKRYLNNFISVFKNESLLDVRRVVYKAQKMLSELDGASQTG